MVSALDSSLAGEPAAWRLWLRATRPESLLTSVLPAAVAGVSVLNQRHAKPGLLAVALVALLCVHAAVNVANDTEDAAHGVDPPDKLRNSQVFSTGQMTLGAGRRLYLTLASVGTLLGIVICAFQGPALLVIGSVGVLGGLLYTVGPIPYKHLGLGELAIVWLMGPLITQGTATAVDGTAFSAPVFWLGLAPGLMITAVLAANNLTDLPGDAAAGVRTLAVRIGFGRARVLYVALLLGALATVPVLWLCGAYDAWLLLGLLAVLPCRICLRTALAARRTGDAVLEPLTGQTAQVHVALSLALLAAMILIRI